MTAPLIPTDRAVWKASWRRYWSPYWYRETAGPDWMQWLWTVMFGTAIAVIVTLMSVGAPSTSDWLLTFWRNFVVAQSISLTIHVLLRGGGRVLGEARLDALTMPGRVLFYGGAPIAGVIIGLAIGLTLLGVDVVAWASLSPKAMVSIAVFALLITVFMYHFMGNRARVADLEAERQREQARAAQIERDAADARLRALQAQIEPHFLFNTLANVVSLIDTEPAQARQMVNRLIDLLRGSLDASRAADGTLAQEVALVRAYLDILAIRMGPRLAYKIDVPEALCARPFPPLALQPLVENAIKHGLEPKVAGGHVEIRARASESGLTIEVQDDGLGFHPTASSGVGLSNLSERLASRFGVDARIVIEERSPGTLVRLHMPAVGAAMREPAAVGRSGDAPRTVSNRAPQ